MDKIKKQEVRIVAVLLLFPWYILILLEILRKACLHPSVYIPGLPHSLLLSAKGLLISYLLFKQCSNTLKDLSRLTPVSSSWLRPKSTN